MEWGPVLSQQWLKPSQTLPRSLFWCAEVREFHLPPCVVKLNSAASVRKGRFAIEFPMSFCNGVGEGEGRKNDHKNQRGIILQTSMRKGMGMKTD